jgi:hypothetical protein
MAPERTSKPTGTAAVRADPAQLSRLASATLDFATALADGWRANAHLLAPDAPAERGAEAPRRAAVAAATSADLALRRLAEVLAGDADRLWQTAFAYEEADNRARRRLGPGRPE